MNSLHQTPSSFLPPIHGTEPREDPPAQPPIRVEEERTASVHQRALTIFEALRQHSPQVSLPAPKYSNPTSPEPRPLAPPSQPFPPRQTPPPASTTSPQEQDLSLHSFSSTSSPPKTPLPEPLHPRSTPPPPRTPQHRHTPPASTLPSQDHDLSLHSFSLTSSTPKTPPSETLHHRGTPPPAAPPADIAQEGDHFHPLPPLHRCGERKRLPTLRDLLSPPRDDTWATTNGSLPPLSGVTIHDTPSHSLDSATAGQRHRHFSPSRDSWIRRGDERHEESMSSSAPPQTNPDLSLLLNPFSLSIQTLDFPLPHIFSQPPVAEELPQGPVDEVDRPRRPIDQRYRPPSADSDIPSEPSVSEASSTEGSETHVSDVN